MPSFAIPLTGLQSDNTQLNTIANNLANMSTTAFKAQTTGFADLLYQQYGASGAGNPIQVGTGVMVSTSETNFSGGPISGTQNTNDMAINGGGFFVLNDAGSTELTRAGTFSISPGGGLLDPSGATVMGYPVTAGKVNSSAALTPLTLPIGSVEAANATTQLSITANLDAGAKVGSVVPAPATIYDSLGVAHLSTLTFTKTASNTWGYSIALPAGDATTATNNTGSISFDTSGNVLSPVPGITGVGFSGMADGAAPMTFSVQTHSSNGSSLITQVSGNSAVSNTVQDGYTSGTYSGFSVAADGTISATFSNGNTSPIGQLAIANVGNQQGLTDIGANLYRTSVASGAASLGVAGVAVAAQ